jgi:thiol-disulfide isomerase/thioredoxin
MTEMALPAMRARAALRDAVVNSPFKSPAHTPLFHVTSNPTPYAAPDCRRRAGLSLVVNLLLLFWFGGSAASAQDDEPKKEKNDSNESGFFKKQPVDFWKSKPAPRPDAGESGPAIRTTQGHDPEEFWKDSTITEEGKVRTQTPPKILQELLENPTDENAERYLAWQRERLKKIILAQKAVERVRHNQQKAKTQGPNEPGPQESAPSKDIDRHQAPPVAPPSKSAAAEGPRVDWKQVELVYFYAPGCPACKEQEKELDGVKARDVGFALVAVDISRHPEIGQAFDVRATPTFLVKAKAKDRVTKHEGLWRAADLVTAIETFLKEPK